MHRLIACLNVACLAGVCAVTAPPAIAQSSPSATTPDFPVSTTQCSKGAAVAAAHARERRRRARPQGRPNRLLYPTAHRDDRRTLPRSRLTTWRSGK